MPVGSLLRTQFEFETETWKRLLIFLSDENNNAKNRLSDIVKDIGNNDGELIERVENFHNCLLKEDEIIGFLFREVLEHEDLVAKNTVYSDKQQQQATMYRHNTLRTDVRKAKRDFFELSAEFNHWLSEVL